MGETHGRHRTYSIDFTRQVTQAFLGGEGPGLHSIGTAPESWPQARPPVSSLGRAVSWPDW